MVYYMAVEGVGGPIFDMRLRTLLLAVSACFGPLGFVEIPLGEWTVGVPNTGLGSLAESPARTGCPQHASFSTRVERNLEYRLKTQLRTEVSRRFRNTPLSVSISRHVLRKVLSMC